MNNGSSFSLEIVPIFSKQIFQVEGRSRRRQFLSDFLQLTDFSYNFITLPTSIGLAHVVNHDGASQY